MCRNIKTLFNFDPPVTPEEVQAASLQFVRKICGFTKPSKPNEESFLAAVTKSRALQVGSCDRWKQVRHPRTVKKRPQKRRRAPPKDSAGRLWKLADAFVPIQRHATLHLLATHAK